MTLSILKPLKDAWQKRQQRIKDEQQAAATAAAARAYDVKIEGLTGKKDFFVYDGTRNTWGHAFEGVKPAFETIGGVERQIYSMTVFRDRIPRDGDRVQLNLQSGKKGLFVLFDVKRAGNVYDMSFVKGVMIDDDYKGGFGLKAGFAMENSSRPFVGSAPDTAVSLKTLQPAAMK